MARNILVVEDDRNISDLIRMYMEKEGFEVRSAYDLSLIHIWCGGADDAKKEN